jgi:hypothetical protein
VPSIHDGKGYSHAKSSWTFMPNTKEMSKWIKDLNLMPVTIKLIREVMGIWFLDIFLRNDLLGIKLKA